MNLATARSAERAREVGVRKVMGSFRSQLIVQFLTEATLLFNNQYRHCCRWSFFPASLFSIILLEKDLHFVFYT